MRNKILASLCCLFFMAINVYSQEISVSFSSAPLKDVLKAVEKQSEYTFVYNNNLVDANKKVSVEAKKSGIIPVMDQALENTGYEYKIVEKQIVISPVNFSSKTSGRNQQLEMLPQASSGNQETLRVSGKVISTNDGEPIIGASIVVLGTTKGVATGLDGTFTLQIPITAKKVSVSCIGYHKRDLNVNPADLSNLLLITLDDATQFLSEVVVQGYGTTTVKDATGSVSRLTSKEIEAAPMGSSIQGMLQGRAAGVSVMIQSSSPTSPISVNIRGVSSLSTSGAQPLWVIDGVPDYSDATSGDIANSLYNLNLTDVESIDVLKDASATAIYGSRAANGVIIVTTKKGVRGQTPTIDLNIRTGIQFQKNHDLRTLTTEEYKYYTTTLAIDKTYTSGLIGASEKFFIDENEFKKIGTSQWTADQLKIRPDAYMNGNTNWWDEFAHPSTSYQADLSLRGGTEASNYYLSFGYNDVNGFIKGGRSQTYTGRMNFETLMGKFIKIGVSLSGSSRDALNKDGILRNIDRFRPDIEPLNADGSINILPLDTTIENPYISFYNRNNGTGKTFRGTVFAEVALLKGLKFRSAGTTNYSTSLSDAFYKKGTRGYASTFNYRTLRSNESSTGAWENTLTYSESFGKHNIVAVLGQSVEKYTNKSLIAEGEDFPDEEILININSAAVTYGGSNEYSSALASFFARANYKYRNRYLLTATIRTDGSSKFGPDTRWGVFPSGALAWIVSEEEFMKPINDIVPYLKLRFSMGQSGSQNLGYYDWMTTFSSAPYNGASGIKPNNLGNSTLQWESATLKDVGLDFGLLKERLRGTVGYFNKRIDNLIYGGSLPSNSSFASINQNIGSMTNSGWEFEIKGDVIKKRGMTLELGFNISGNKSIINRLDGFQKEIFLPSYYQWGRLAEGAKLGDWYGFKTAGRLFATAEEIYAIKSLNPTTGIPVKWRLANDMPGDPYVLDVDGDGTITNADKTVIGNFNPKLYGGFNISFTYKNLYASAIFSYSYGAKRMWNYAFNAVNSGTGFLNAYNYLMENGYAFTKDPLSGIPRAGLSYTGAVLTDSYLFDASYIKLNALNISYRLPKRWFDKKFISGADFTLQASNLWTITKYPGFDPQGSFGSTDMSASYVVGSANSRDLVSVGAGIDYNTYPSTVSFSLGLKLTFK